MAVLNAGDLIPGDCVVARVEHAARRRGRPDRRDVSRGKDSLVGSQRPSRSSSAPTPYSSARTSSVAREPRSGRPHRGDRRNSAQCPRVSRKSRPPTGFQRGMTEFGYLLLRVMIVLVAAIFIVNVVLARPAPRLCPLCARARGRAYSAAAAGNRDDQPVPGRAAHGARARHREAPRSDRGLRGNVRPVHGQDRHDDRRHRRAPGRDRGSMAARVTTSAASPSSTPNSRPASPTRSTTRSFKP